MQFDPAHLAALDAVLSLGSFEAAAARLNVTPSAVSQRIRALEDRVGTALVVRASPCRPTPEGARLARHAADVALLEHQLATELGQPPAPGARLRLAINADSLASWVLPALAATDHLFDILIDDQAHSADWLRRGEVAAAITDRTRAVQGCVAHPLGGLHYIATCAPGFHARWFGDGVTAAALARAPMLQFNEKDALQSTWMARLTGTRPSPPTHRLAASQDFVTAARLGMGWGMNPAPLVAEALRDGTLVPLCQDAEMAVPLTWQVRRLTAPALHGLTKAVQKAARHALSRHHATPGMPRG
jgi:LysR family transcriptional regulator (chromosome initiation inhibitor)